MLALRVSSMRLSDRAIVTSALYLTSPPAEPWLLGKGQGQVMLADKLSPRRMPS